MQICITNEWPRTNYRTTACVFFMLNPNNAQSGHNGRLEPHLCTTLSSMVRVLVGVAGLFAKIYVHASIFIEPQLIYGRWKEDGKWIVGWVGRDCMRRVNAHIRYMHWSVLFCSVLFNKIHYITYTFSAIYFGTFIKNTQKVLQATDNRRIYYTFTREKPFVPCERFATVGPKNRN